MKLVLAKDSPSNTTLIDDASGVVMYEIETEKGFFSKTTVIRKPLINRRGERMPNASMEVAKIQWKTWSSDTIVYHGREMSREEFMSKVGIFRESFVITAGGKEYRWSTSGRLPKLVTNDSSKMLVAKLHEAHHIFNRRKAFLEVTPAGVVILDMIVVSLVYVESKRRERLQSDAGGG